MIAQISKSVQSDLGVPSDLIKFAEIAKRGILSVCSLHRWRLHPEMPLPCWRIGGCWHVSEAELASWILRRSGRAEFPPSAPPAAPAVIAPPHTARRRKQIASAVAECQRRGC